MGRFERSIDVPVRPAAAYKHLLNNLVWILREVPDVADTQESTQGTNRSFLVTTRSASGEKEGFVLHLDIGWRWKSPLSFATAASKDRALPASYRPANGTVTVRPGGGGAQVEVIVEVEGLADDDVAFGGVLDHGAEVFTRRLPQKRVRWY